MSAIEEMDRQDGIIHCTPQAVAELVAEIRRLRGMVDTLRELREFDCKEMQRLRRALEPKP
jgi:hypothetical protein